MKIVKKNVYYCDFCKKRTLSAYSIKLHEHHCTANPDRECRLCGFGNVKDIVADLNTKFEIKEHDQNARNIETTNYIEWKDKPVTLEEIKKMVDGCPVCTLAVLRQTQLNYKCVGFSFDFSGDSQKYLNEKREEEAKSDYYGGYVLPREVNRM